MRTRIILINLKLYDQQQSIGLPPLKHTATFFAFVASHVLSILV